MTGLNQLRSNFAKRLKRVELPPSAEAATADGCSRFSVSGRRQSERAGRPDALQTRCVLLTRTDE
jgi:hypothetical protein